MNGIPEIVIKEERISHLLEDEGKIIGSVDITYPQISWNNTVTEQYINGVYHTIANNFYRYIMSEVYPRHIKKRSIAKSDGLIIAQSLYHNTLNKGGIISGYSDDTCSKMDTGIEHIVRVAVSFNTVTGRHIWLSSLFKRFSGYRKRIIKLILETISQNKANIKYKDNIGELVELNFYTGNFYLTEKSIVVFYQPGDITEEKDFVPTFTISKLSLRDILK